MSMPNTGKIMIVREIFDVKDILFSPLYFNQTKIEAWTNILEKAKSLGLVAPSKDYKYIRDVFWENIRKTAVSKRENTDNTIGKVKETPIDDMVYEIVDKYPSVLHETTLTDSMVLEPTQNIFEGNYCLGPENYIRNGTCILEGTKFGLASPRNDHSSKKDAIEETTSKKDHNKKKKKELQIEHLELQNYKIKLEILKLEQEIGIKHSKFTKEIVKRKNKNSLIFENSDDESDSLIDD